MTKQHLLTFFFFGDSITWGMTDSHGGWAHRLSKQIKQYCHENAETHVMDYVLGIPGNTSADLLQRVEPELAARQMDGWDTICLFAIGTNDCQYDLDTKSPRVTDGRFKKQIIEIIQRAHRHGVKHIAFLGLPPVDEIRTKPMAGFPNLALMNDDITRKNTVLKSVCDEHKTVFIDTHATWPKNMSERAALLDDGLHPNDAGHAKLHQQIYTAFVHKILLGSA